MGGYLVTKGYLKQVWDEQAIAGFVSGAIAIGWAIWDKYHTGRAIKTALALPPGATEADLKAVLKEKKEHGS